MPRKKYFEPSPFRRKLRVARFPYYVTNEQGWISAERARLIFDDDFMMNGHVNSLLSQGVIKVEYKNGILGYRGLPFSERKYRSANCELPNHPLYC